jgi:hypothetical protein
MLPVVRVVLILEIEKSSLERFDLRARPARLPTPWYGVGGDGPLLFANFRSCSVERRHLGHKRFATLATPLLRARFHRGMRAPSEERNCCRKAAAKARLGAAISIAGVRQNFPKASNFRIQFQRLMGCELSFHHPGLRRVPGHHAANTASEYSERNRRVVVGGRGAWQ